jgi:trans-2,3-dihydro-3-hydroxyanthranilate isomerase
MILTIVDVFAEARYEGNQLAVIRGAGSLDTAAMQAIAREMNFSETTFVIEEAPGRARVRIFMPAGELPFAGHPTLGTAWVLGRQGREYTLDLPAGEVRVEFRDGIVWMTPPAAELGALLAPERAAALVGLTPADLDPALPPRMVSCGPVFPLIAVRNLETLRRIRVERERQLALEIAGFPFVVCRPGYSADARFAARMMFFDGVGMREDPATGSASAAFAHYLKHTGEQGAFVVEQGFEIMRPARIYVDLTAQRLRIGGKVQPVAEGRLD